MCPTVEDVRSWDCDEPITMLTAYDAPTAALIDDAGIDMILVGDSMGNAILGYDSTLPVTIDEVASRTAAVARAVEDALVIADMPFLSYGADEATSIENCGQMLKEANATAVKLESGPHTVALTETLVNLGIPVMAHLGLTPQHIHQYGSLRQRGTSKSAAEELLDLAKAHEEAGAFALVLEHIPANLAERVTDITAIPTIGIGAGADCDGQVLVLTDVIGLSDDLPPFAERFGDVREEIATAIEAYRSAVVTGAFPNEEHMSEQPELFDS